jgi:hypothetical protein
MNSVYNVLTTMAPNVRVGAISHLLLQLPVVNPVSEATHS